MRKAIAAIMILAGLVLFPGLKTVKAEGSSPVIEYEFEETLKSRKDGTEARLQGQAQYEEGAILLGKGECLNFGRIPETDKGNCTILLNARIKEETGTMLTNGNITLEAPESGVEAHITLNSHSYKETRDGAESHIRDRRWNQYLISINRNGKFSFYINGKLVTATDISNSVGVSAGAKDWTTGDNLEIDSFKIWDKAFSQSEAEQAYREWGEDLKGRLQEQAKGMKLDKALKRAEGITDTYIANKILYTAIETAGELKPDADLSFAVFADYHIFMEEGPQGIYDAIGDSLGLSSEGMDSIIHLGDMTCDGFTDKRVVEREYVTELINYYKQYVNNQVVFGNHETGLIADGKDDTELFNRNGVPWYRELTGQDQLWYEEYIKGYHFINLNSEAPDISYHMVFSDEQLGWLKEALAKDKDKSKPVFINIHEPFTRTTEWEKDQYGMGKNSDAALRDILRDYPNAVIFTGHMHNDKETIGIHQQDFGTLVDCPSIRYNDSTGWVVNVYGNELELRLRDYKTDQWLSDYDIRLTVPGTDVYDTSVDLTETMTYSKGKEELTDQDGTTGISLNTGEYIEMELPKRTRIKGIKLQSTITTDYQDFQGMPSGMQIEVSQDGETYEQVASVTIPKSCAYHYYDFGKEVKASHIRVCFTGAYDGTGINIAELTAVENHETQDLTTRLFDFIKKVIRIVCFEVKIFV